jgi:hypothetical protein
VIEIPAKDRRKRLFKKSRPLVRPIEEKDAGILWAAYKNGAFGLPPDLEQEVFLLEIAKRFKAYQLVWIVEDDCRHFKKGRGPIAIVGVKTDGWVYEPTPMFFPWARRANALRVTVNFFNMMWSKKEVGVCLVKTGKEHAQFLGHLKKFGVLYQRGRIPYGSPRGDVFVFSINGKKSPMNESING